MTLKQVVMYQVLCDRCGEPDDDSDYYAWATPDQAVDRAVDDGMWHRIVNPVTHEESLYCPGCCEWDEETDDLRVKAPLVTA